MTGRDEAGFDSPERFAPGWSNLALLLSKGKAMRRLMLSVLAVPCLAGLARADEILDVTTETVAAARSVLERSQENPVDKVQKEIDATKERMATAKPAEKKKLAAQVNELQAKLKEAKAQPIQVNKLNFGNLRVGLMGGVNLIPEDSHLALESPLVVEELKGENEFVARLKGPAGAGGKTPPLVIRGVTTKKLKVGTVAFLKGVFKVSGQTREGELFIIEPYLRAAPTDKKEADKNDSDPQKAAKEDAVKKDPPKPETKAEAERNAAQMLKQAKALKPKKGGPDEAETQALKEIVEKYPETKAAAEAERLLKGSKK